MIMEMAEGDPPYMEFPPLRVTILPYSIIATHSHTYTLTLTHNDDLIRYSDKLWRRNLHVSLRNNVKTTITLYDDARGDMYANTHLSLFPSTMRRLFS